MTARCLVCLIAFAIAANPVIAQNETGNTVPEAEENIIHEAFPSFVPFDLSDVGSCGGCTIEPPERGEIIAIPQVGGLYHRYTRAA